MDKSEYDGSDKKVSDNNANGNETSSDTPSNGSQPVQNYKSSRKKETASRAEKTKLKVGKIIIHEVDEYTLLRRTVYET